MEPSSDTIKFNNNHHFVRYTNSANIVDGVVQLGAFMHRLDHNEIEEYLSGMHYEQGLSNNTITNKDNDIHSFIDFYINIIYMGFNKTGIFIKLKSCEEVQRIIQPLMSKGTIRFEKDIDDTNINVLKYHLKFIGFNDYYKLKDVEGIITIEHDADLDDILFKMYKTCIDRYMVIKDIENAGKAEGLVRPKNKVQRESSDWLYNELLTLDFILYGKG
jgi:hypothetical protein